MSFVLPGSATPAESGSSHGPTRNTSFSIQRFETFHERPKHVYSQAEMPTMPAASPSSNSSINRNIFGPYGNITPWACTANLVETNGKGISPINC